jgi:hypothetical protein
MLLIHALTLIGSLAADAAHPKPLPPPALNVTAHAGFIRATGNTSVQTLNLGDRVIARHAALAFTQPFAVVHGRSHGATVTVHWRGMPRADLTLYQDIGLDASVSFERNTFAGLAERVGAGTGLGGQLVKTKADKLVVEGGVSLIPQRRVVASAQDAGFVGGRVATAYVHQLGPRASIAQIELPPNLRDRSDLRVNTETDLLVPFPRRAAVKRSYVIHYDGLPEPGYFSTDRLFTSGIQVTL